MAYTILAARAADAEHWRRLREQLWEDEDHAAEIAAFFRQELEEPVQVLIAWTTEGEAAAHVELSLRQDITGLEGVKTGYIEGLYVEPGHRSGGLVPLLLRASEHWAADQGCAAFASDRDDRVIVHRRFMPRTRAD